MRKLWIFVALVCAVSAHAQQDPPQWAASTAFVGGGLTRGPDGNFYRAIRNSIGHDPTRDNHTYWELYYVRASVNLTVASTKATFNSLVRAWDFVASATIASTARVVIHINTSNGNFNESFTSGFVLDHPCGTFISISGDDATKIKLTFPTAVTGFLISQGCSFGGITNLTLDGTQSTSNGACGVFLSGNSHLGDSSHVTVQHFDIGAGADLGSSAVCVSWTVNTGNYGFYSLTGANLTAESCTAAAPRCFWADTGSTLSARNSVANCGLSDVGFYASGGATISAPGAQTNGGLIGFQALDRAEIIANYAKASSASTGFSAASMSHINAKGATTPSCTTGYSPAVNTVSADNSLISQ